MLMIFNSKIMTSSEHDLDTLLTQLYLEERRIERLRRQKKELTTYVEEALKFIKNKGLESEFVEWLERTNEFCNYQ